MLAATIRRDSDSAESGNKSPSSHMGICLVSVRINFPQMRPHSRLWTRTREAWWTTRLTGFQDPHRRCRCVRPGEVGSCRTAFTRE